MKYMTPLPLEQTSKTSLPSDYEKTKQLKIGIFGFGSFGQFLGKKIVKTTHHKVSCVDSLDKVRNNERYSFLFVCLYETNMLTMPNPQ